MRTFTRLATLAALAAALGFAPDARADMPSTGHASLFDDGTGLAFDASLVDDLVLDDGGGQGMIGNGDPLLATILSIIPGLGQVLVRGQVVKGLIIFVIAAILGGSWGYVGWIPGIGGLVASALSLVGFLWWVGNLVDAYTGNFYAFLPNSVQPIGGGSDAPLTRDERLDLVVPVARPAI